MKNAPMTVGAFKLPGNASGESVVSLSYCPQYRFVNFKANEREYVMPSNDTRDNLEQVEYRQAIAAQAAASCRRDGFSEPSISFTWNFVRRDAELTVSALVCNSRSKGGSC